MYRHIPKKYTICRKLRLLYCTKPVEQKETKQELSTPKGEFLRPFSKDMILNQFNLDLFTYPEIDNNQDLNRVNNLADKLQQLMKLRTDKSDRKAGEMIISQLSQSGILGLCVPEMYQGSNYNYMMMARVVEALSADVSYTINVFNPQTLATKALVYGGSEAHKWGHLASLVAGKTRSVVAIQESACDDIRLEAISTTAYLDEQNQQYLLNGTKTMVAGFTGADSIVVFAKTGERMVSAFLVDATSAGISSVPCQQNSLIDPSCCHVRLENVTVPRANLLDKIDGIKLARKLAAVHNVSITASCSALTKSILQKTNAFVCSRNIFGKPLSKFETISYHITKLANEAYAAESVAFFSAGLQDQYPDSDVYIESCISKVCGLEALSRSLNLSLKIMGTKAVSNEDAEFVRVFNNAQTLMFNQVPRLETKYTIGRESLEYLRDNIHAKKGFFEKLIVKFGMMKIKGVMDNKDIVDSFKYNLHQRVSEFTNDLYKDLFLLMKFLQKSSKTKDQNLQNDEESVEKLSDILVNLYSVIAILGRASRSIAIGVRNHEQEIKIAEYHSKLVMLKIKKQVDELKQHSANVNKIRLSAGAIKEMGGYFVHDASHTRS